MIKYTLIILGILAGLPRAKAQTLFPDACLGTWTGTMHIYSRGSLKDSVPVRLTVAKTTTDTVWTWKTAYLSTKTPVVKDYTLRLKDASKGVYITDEGDGLELTNYLFAHKLYSVFETSGLILTATYELQGNELIFEVTSGKKLPLANGEVTNCSVDNLQRVVFRKSQ